MLDATIRNEEERDFSEVEILTRKAFWNVNVLGCENYGKMRNGMGVVFERFLRS